MPTAPTPTQPELASATDASSSLDFHEYWRVLIRRRWLVIPFFLATVLVTTLITLRQIKVYSATCTIIIDLSAPKILEKDQVQEVVETGTGGYWYSKEYYETQYKVLASRAVAQRVADKLQLATNDQFLGIDKVADPKLRDELRKKRDAPFLLYSHLRIEPVKESRIVRVRFEDGDPQRAAQIANAFADAYIAENLSVRTTTTQGASEWLEGQLNDLEVKLQETGKALFQFKKDHDIVAASWDDRQNMVSQRLTATNDALTKARVRKAELQARNDAIASLSEQVEQDQLGEASAAPGIASSLPIQGLKVRYLEARTECADMKVRYLDDHPKLQACREKVTTAREALRDELRSSIAAARQEYQEVQKTEKNLEKLLNDTKTDAFALNQHEREYSELKRSFDNNQRLYDVVLKRLKDTGVSGALQSSNIRILDRARAPTVPIRPNVPRNVLIAIALGLLAGCALAFAVEYLDTSITSQEQVENRIGVAFLGIIPSIDRNKDGTPQDLIVHTQPKSAVAECLRAVRTNLLFMSPEKPLRTILVTSSGPQEGKTTAATSLAITMANSGNRVLLVDADMRRPRIHRVFGIQNTAGLSSLILGDGTLGDLVNPTLVPNLSVLPCGPVPPNPAELLHTAAFRRLLEEMAGKFDRVILDSPPVSVVADAVVMGTRVDGTLIVLKAGKTSREVARLAVRQLRDVNAPLFGAVLNDLDLEDQKYGQYSYYYRYGYYYGDGGTRTTKVA
jgi:polysaccharide biosynthesis transport protein